MLLKEVAITMPRPLAQADAEVESVSRVVCSLLVKAWAGRVKPSKFWKISIRVNHADSSDDGRVLQGVLVKHARLDVAAFARLPTREKGVAILDLVVPCLEGVFHSEGLPLERLHEARRFVIENEFRNTFAARPGVVSPSGQRSAHVAAEQGLEAANVELVVESKQAAALRRIPIATDSPDEFIFQRHFGKIKWLDEDRLTLTRVDGTEIPIDLRAN
jgi:hypothetical protein